MKMNKDSKQQHRKKLNMLRQRRFTDRKKERIASATTSNRGYHERALKLHWGGESGLHKFWNLSQFELKTFKAWDATFPDYNLSLLHKEFKHPQHVTTEQAAEIEVIHKGMLFNYEKDDNMESEDTHEWRLRTREDRAREYAQYTGFYIQEIPDHEYWYHCLHIRDTSRWTYKETYYLLLLMGQT
eukprot:scaffold17213_cov57-Attheya_sp.AAC.4